MKNVAQVEPANRPHLLVLLWARQRDRAAIPISAAAPPSTHRNGNTRATTTCVSTGPPTSLPPSRPRPPVAARHSPRPAGQPRLLGRRVAARAPLPPPPANTPRGAPEGAACTARGEEGDAPDRRAAARHCQRRRRRTEGGEKGEQTSPRLPRPASTAARTHLGGVRRPAAAGAGAPRRAVAGGTPSADRRAPAPTGQQLRVRSPQAGPALFARRGAATATGGESRGGLGRAHIPATPLTPPGPSRMGRPKRRAAGESACPGGLASRRSAGGRGSHRPPPPPLPPSSRPRKHRPPRWRRRRLRRRRRRRPYRGGRAWPSA